ncbi:acyl-CoA thioesterase [Sinimarinibacterium sp. CAU 1509]|uniref:acyl-CoA thioesterase n=1 Tax=Sinimarinibacterium sp. CAU 1509 TaxID=2562283 RepID=UPI0010AD804D|nr:thioesterase family protein [Sinimarinibacterium sp. CAU 1509]TJY58868.1 acyl-CoA thioesterase [Sinimarinibacterium sp. CAU 1509]
MNSTAIHDATAVASYPYWTREHVRFADLDMQGHVNNVAFAVFAETGRAAFLREIELWVPHAERYSVIVKLEINYRRELMYPCDIRVGVRVTQIGRTSFTVGVGLFDGDHCAATIDTVHVRMTQPTRTPVPLNDEERAQLQRWLRP